MNARLVALAICYFATFCYGTLREPEDKIVGGTEIDIVMAPYMLSYFIDDYYMCSAVIRNEEWAITAAHCVASVDGNSSTITVRSGSSYYMGGTVHNVSEAIIHEKYNSATSDYDIAVLRVIPNFVFDNYTKPVGIAQNASETDITFGEACGWGLYNATTPVSETLECTILPHVNRVICQIELIPYKLTDRMTCYGYAKGGEDTCTGDSGGGLVNNNNTLIGITSWGIGCAQKLSPGVYTDTVKLKDWITASTPMSTS